LSLALAPEKAFPTALATAKKMSWTIVEADPTTRRIEASEHSFWMGFTYDATLHQMGELAGHCAAGEGVELDRHHRLRSAALAAIPRIPSVCEARIAASSIFGNGELGPRRRLKAAPRLGHPVAARPARSRAPVPSIR